MAAEKSKPDEDEKETEEKAEEEFPVKKVRDDIEPLVGKINKRYLSMGKPRPVFKTTMTFDSTAEGLEPMYFWVLDFMRAPIGLKVEKLVDNFTATPGSGYFAELGGRATRMQDEAMKILGSVNTVIKSIINIIYDLKEFEIRLKHYEAAKSKNKDEKQAGILALKQIWMDNVDVKRGRGSINMLTYELSFSTLRDAFMVANSIEDVDKIDLNDRVKRILKPRVAEFLEWWKRSETELKKRFEIEKTYLRSQVSALQLYSRWVKPYLTAAERLTSGDTGTSPDLINSFNTMLLELALLGVKKIDYMDEAYNKNLPYNFIKLKEGKQIRPFYICVFIDLSFRAIPRRVSEQGHYAFGGRADIDFVAYALNEDELTVLKKEIQKSDIANALKLAEGVTTESLDILKDDIDKYLKDEGKEEKNEKKETENPFVALFSFAKKPQEKKSEKKEGKEKDLKIGEIKKDNFYELKLRELTEFRATDSAFKIFDTLKKAYGMASMMGGLDVTEYMQGRDKPRL